MEFEHKANIECNKLTCPFRKICLEGDPRDVERFQMVAMACRDAEGYVPSAQELAFDNHWL